MEKAQFLIGLSSIVGTVLKVACGAFLSMRTCISRLTLFLLSLLFMSFSHVIAAFATEYIHFVCYAICIGVCDGILASQLPVIVVDLIPNKAKVGVALANLFAVISVPMIVGPLLAGGWLCLFIYLFFYITYIFAK